MRTGTSWCLRAFMSTCAYSCPPPGRVGLPAVGQPRVLCLWLLPHIRSPAEPVFLLVNASVTLIPKPALSSCLGYQNVQVSKVVLESHLSQCSLFPRLWSLIYKNSLAFLYFHPKYPSFLCLWFWMANFKCGLHVSNNHRYTHNSWQSLYSYHQKPPLPGCRHAPLLHSSQPSSDPQREDLNHRIIESLRSEKTIKII